MSITVEVTLLSGKKSKMRASLGEKVQALQLRAQMMLEVGKGRLLDSSGKVLDAGAQIQQARVQNGDSLTLQINRVQVCAAEVAFAAVLGDTSVVTWGHSSHGGDSSAVQDQLKNVQQIQVTAEAFAAILGDGSVLTWGSPAHGGDSSAVKDQLQNVQQVQATARGDRLSAAFAAILGDGSVVT
eukprot:s112_g27.t1